jgi:hypothetical protein
MANGTTDVVTARRWASLSPSSNRSASTVRPYSGG